MMLRFSRGIYKFCSKGVSHLTNPYTGELISDKEYISQNQIFDKISTTMKAYREWNQQSIDERIKLTQKLVKSIIQDEEVLKEVISSELGKSHKHIGEEFSTINNVVWEFIEDARIALKEQVVRDDNIKLQKYHFEPVGLSLIFPFYSEPILDSIMHLVPCLITGGAALIKSSDYNHFLGGYLERKAKSVIGIKGLISDVFIKPSQLPELAQFRSIKKVIYSGEQTYARHIFETMVKNRFIDCNLFFGGQDAAYIDQTADLHKTAQQICHFSFYNNGQSYDCIKRLYLHSSIQDQFLQLLSQEVHNLILGNPKNPLTDLGPLCAQEEALRFEHIVTDAINDDAVCMIGGVISNDGQGSGLFCEPTVLKNCSSDMPVVQTQLAAPVLCAMEVKSVQEFVEMVNENQYGTGIRIYTSCQSKYDQWVDQIEVGRIVFNSASILGRNLPIQGWKKSGKGKIMSTFSYMEYTLPKVFNISKLEN